MAYTRPDPTQAPGSGPRPRSEDPRTIITPDAFHIQPSLLGAPLASPSRRLVAMLIDLVLLGFVVNAPGWLFALLTAFVLWRATSRKSGARGGVGRFFLRVAGVLVAFVGVLSMLGAIGGLFSGGGEGEGRRADDDAPAATEAPDAAAAAIADAAPDDRAPAAEEQGTEDEAADGVVPTPTGVLREMFALGRAETAEEARPHAAATARFFAAQGDRVDDVEELREALEGLGDLPGLSMNDEVFAVVEQEFRRAGVLPDEAAGDPAVADADIEALLETRRAALEEGDSTAAADAGRAAALVLAADTIGRLDVQVRALRRDVSAQRERADEAERAAERTPLQLMMDLIADEVGVSAGWAALYFTAMLALWRGRTPGKRALGIRVIRLDGKPLGWFASFERFGGYAAALATGTLGFFQILWDRNRQGVHDKISQTVVIRDLAPEHVVHRRVSTG
jgi:PAS domain-containing protein